MQGREGGSKIFSLYTLVSKHKLTFCLQNPDATDGWRMKCPQFKGCPSDQECLPGIPDVNPKGPLSGSPTHPG